MENINNVLFVSHKENKCGVYQFGNNIGHALKKSKKFNFIYVECSSVKELKQFVSKYKPTCIIYNYHVSTLSWLNKKITFNFDIPQIGIIHEATQKVVDSKESDFFDFYIAPDPTLISKNAIVYKTGRLLHLNKIKKENNNSLINNDIPIIGSFGFASYNKNFDLLVKLVCESFDEAIIRLNIPFAHFGDKDGISAKKVVSDCQEIIKSYKNIKLMCTHDFLSKQELLDFLNSNIINVFLYTDDKNRGISSVIDYALSVRVPIAISNNSTMFRHIENASPSIVLTEKNRLSNIIENGTKPLEEYYNEWTEDNLIWDYERIVSDVLNKYNKKNRYDLKQKIIKAVLKNIFGYVARSTINNWAYNIKNYEDSILEYNPNIKYEEIDIPSEKLLYNRILNDEARVLYKSAIEFLEKVLPKWIERKPERANIQQGFMLDTVIRLSKNIPDPKILSVGCFEDTAWGAIKKLGYNIAGVDPVLNYDLDTYLSKPSVKNKYFDIVFSTSVIEHVEDDLTFLKNMCQLTKIDGYIIITCDFKEGYQEGDHKPVVDYRFYTKEYLTNLISNISNCVLLDGPNWACPNPDFEWDIYKYTFASVVLKKR